VGTPQVEAYKRITLDPNIRCEVKIDMWRQSDVDAYEIFKPNQGSDAHYQAVSIIKYKIRGSGRLLVAHNFMNFDITIPRLEGTYADKAPLRVLRHGLETVRQGDLNLMQYYDDVEAAF